MLVSGTLSVDKMNGVFLISFPRVRQYYITLFPYFPSNVIQRVTPWNAGKLRDAVINGPDIHPGATHYEDSVSSLRLPAKKKMRIAVSRKLPSSRGIVSQSGKISEHEFEGKIVRRHLQDGDIVLVNRQVLERVHLIINLFDILLLTVCMISFCSFLYLHVGFCK